MEKALNPKKTLKRLWSYLKKDRLKLGIVTFFVLIATVSSVLAPYLLSVAVDQFVGKENMRPLFFLCIILVFLYLLVTFSRWVTNYIMVGVSEQLMYRLRTDLFDHLEKLDLRFFDQHKKGDLMSRFTNDITIIDDALSEAVVQIISSVLMLLGVTVIMFIMNPLLALTTIITVPIFFWIVVKIGVASGNYFMKQQENLGKLNSAAEEMMTGMRVIKSYCKEEDSVLEFERYNHDLKEVSVKAELYSNLVIPANVAVNNIGYVLIIAVGSIMTVYGYATIGNILAFVTYADMFRRPINQLATLYASIQAALAGAERVFEVMDQKIEVTDVENPVLFDSIEGFVSLEHVYFGYTKDKPILKDINLEVSKGESIALVGPTGAGKTTIINLLTRFYDVDHGVIKIDGIDISKVRQNELRKKIGIVLQDTHLFKGTVKENIRYGNEFATDLEVIEASKKAQAHQFIHRLPNGYDSIVEEEGSNFSEGERQLITIARAILANPNILVLDEATSNVDTRTELQINQGMKELMNGRTSFVIAHRLSTIRSADMILVLHHGEIVERGNHDALLKQKGFYYDLYMSQFED